jgi:hypothetical protein
MVDGDWEGLVRDGMAPAHRSGEELSYWVRSHPARLAPLAPEAWELSDHGQVEPELDTWWVVLPLWTVNEGRSDLSLEATVREQSARVTVQIDGVHVL